MSDVSVRRIDTLVLLLIGAVLAYSALIFMSAYLSGSDMGTWVWNRHQNLFSWYSRPVFIVPAAYYAYRRKLWHILGFMVLLLTSLFWFDAPTTVSPTVSEYLQWEEQLFFTNDNNLPLIALTVGATLFLFLLFYAFWQRNVWYGLALINAGTLLKIVVSIGLGQEAGSAAIAPSLSSLLAINLIAWGVYRRTRGSERPLRSPSHSLGSAPDIND